MRRKLPPYAAPLLYGVYFLILETVYYLRTLAVLGTGMDHSYLRLAIWAALLAPLAVTLFGHRSGTPLKEYVTMIRTHCFFCLFWFLGYYFLCASTFYTFAMPKESIFTLSLFDWRILDWQWQFSVYLDLPFWWISTLADPVCGGLIFWSVLLIFILPALPRRTHSVQGTQSIPF